MSTGFDKLAAIHAMLDAGEPQRAMNELRTLIRREPLVASWQGMMARASTAAGLYEQALLHARRCTQMAPTHPTSWAEMGDALHHLGRMEEARAAYAKGVELEATSVIAALGLANVLADMGRFGEAARLLQDALAKIPGNEALLGKYSMVLGKLAKMSDALEAAEAALEKFPRSWELAQCACSASNYVVEDPQRLFEIHARFGRTFEYRCTVAAPPISRPDPNRPIRIGLLSADFRGHSVSHFVEPLLEHIDRKTCELILFATGPSDDVTRQLKSYGHIFLDFFLKPRRELIDTIRSRQLDVLLDLNGHTRGGDAALLRSHVAPLQGNYCGYPNTLGMKSVDFRLIDEITDPSGESDKFSIEKLVRIDGCFLCYKPRPGALNLETTRLTGEPFTFGCFNAARKLSDPFLKLCAEICIAAPTARLLFKSLDFKDAECMSLIRERAIRAGIPEGRLVLEGPSPQPQDHLTRYRSVDIALDSYPYSGTTTTCESLFMGVPVITLLGKTHPSRVSASLIMAVGLDGCIARNPLDFVNLAIEGMKQIQEQGQSDTSRSSLRQQMLRSELCNGPLFSRRFVDAVRGVWLERLASQGGA